MKLKTFESFKKHLNNIKKQNIPITKYELNNNLSKGLLLTQKIALEKDNGESGIDDKQKLKYLELYNSISNKNIRFVKTSKFDINVIRDENEKITQYNFKINGSNPLSGTISRDNMDLLCRLYSREGSNLSQRDVARYFPEYSIIDLRRIISIFGITKASIPFAQHTLEESTPEELSKLTLNAKKNDFYKVVEYEEIKVNKELAKKYIRKEFDLDKRKEEIYEAFAQESYFKKLPKFESNFSVHSDNNLMLHLADFHIGAYVGPTSEFDNVWNEEELYKRLTNLLNSIYSLGMNFDTIVLNVLGDMLDGFYGQTTRRDHYLQQNMGNTEQIRVYKESTIWFINELFKSRITNKIRFYSVPGGNHDGFTMGETTKLIFLTAKMMFPNFVDNVEVDNIPVSDKFYMDYEFNNRIFVITHGKDDQFMKRPLPINLDPAAKGLINDMLINRNLFNQGKPIHIIKGDMHNDNLNSSLHYDYRTCLSLFGATDYCQSNYTANKRGVSYELFLGDQMIRGIFEKI